MLEGKKKKWLERKESGVEKFEDEEEKLTHKFTIKNVKRKREEEKEEVSESESGFYLFIYLFYLFIYFIYLFTLFIFV
jgi:ABC-type Na+ efflux pump permease subunit